MDGFRFICSLWPVCIAAAAADDDDAEHLLFVLLLRFQRQQEGGARMEGCGRMERHVGRR